MEITSPVLAPAMKETYRNLPSAHTAQPPSGAEKTDFTNAVWLMSRSEANAFLRETLRNSTLIETRQGLKNFKNFSSFRDSRPTAEFSSISQAAHKKQLLAQLCLTVKTTP
ncbi:MAG: hypothetical protein JW888_02385 [Pirellulales bacterium]|nr:hypothetical protein [Pirellulales bacterium]